MSGRTTAAAPGTAQMGLAGCAHEAGGHGGEHGGD
jgi:hypothetical protein